MREEWDHWDPYPLAEKRKSILTLAKVLRECNYFLGRIRTWKREEILKDLSTRLPFLIWLFFLLIILSYRLAINHVRKPNVLRTVATHTLYLVDIFYTTSTWSSNVYIDYTEQQKPLNRVVFQFDKRFSIPRKEQTCELPQLNDLCKRHRKGNICRLLSFTVYVKRKCLATCWDEVSSLSLLRLFHYLLIIVLHLTSGNEHRLAHSL